MASTRKGPDAPTKLNKLTLGVKHIIKHKNLVKFDEVDAEDDQNYAAASERFLELQTQLDAIILHATNFRTAMEECLNQAAELADDFSRISTGRGTERMAEPWAKVAASQAFTLKAMFQESIVAVKQHLGLDLDEKVLRTLLDSVANFKEVQIQMRERYNMKVEMNHYSNKLQELKDNTKATDEKKDRNKEKYAQASQNLRDRTNQLMSTFALAEQLRQRILVQDLPTVIALEKITLDALAVNMNKATTNVPLPASNPRLGGSVSSSHSPTRLGSSIDFPPTPPSHRLADVNLDDDAALTVSTSSPKPGFTALSPKFHLKMEPSPPKEPQQGAVRKLTPTGLSPKDGHPWTGSGDGGGEFAQELKRAQAHQISKMSAESEAPGGGGGGNSRGDSATTSASAAPHSPMPLSPNLERDWSDASQGNGTAIEDSMAIADDTAAVCLEASEHIPGQEGDVQGEGVGLSSGLQQEEGDGVVTEDLREKVKLGEEGDERLPVALPTYSSVGGVEVPVVVPVIVEVEEREVVEEGSGEVSREGIEDSDGDGISEEEELEPPVATPEADLNPPPGKMFVQALYDYEATQDGDLSFRMGDMIITDEGAFAGDGWVTGECNGNVGIFPANYTSTL